MTQTDTSAQTDVGSEEWVEVTTLDDIWEGETLAVTVEDVDVLVLNVKGEIRAFADKCPHLSTPLSTGNFDGEMIQCAAHQWQFNAEDGTGINPASACMLRYDVRVDDDDDKVYVNVHNVLQELKGMN